MDLRARNEESLIDMNFSGLFTNAAKTVKSNSPEIFTALAVTGVVTTAYLTAKAAYVASEIINANESAGGVHNDRLERFKERARQTWRLYIPAGISGGLTVGCIIGASKASNSRTTAAVTAYSISERAFTEYREKVIEQLGKGKEQKVRDKIAQERVEKTPPGSKEVIIAGTGHVLCCELFTHRYFRSDMETLRKAQNDINARIVNDVYVSLDEFYDLIGLSYTSNSSNLGWDANKLMELQFSTVLSDNGEPCLAFEYNYTKPLK